MKKMIWVSVDNNGHDEFVEVAESREEAFDLTRSTFAHLTARERQKRRLSVEGYAVTVPDGDARSAERMYSDLKNDDSEELWNPTEVYSFPDDFPDED